MGRAKTRLRKSKTARPIKQKIKKTHHRVADPVARPLWNPRRTLQQNYAALGLRLANEGEGGANVNPIKLKKKEKKSDFLDYAEDLSAHPAPARIHVAPGERQFCERMRAKVRVGRACVWGRTDTRGCLRVTVPRASHCRVRSQRHAC